MTRSDLLLFDPRVDSSGAFAGALAWACVFVGCYRTDEYDCTLLSCLNTYSKGLKVVSPCFSPSNLYGSSRDPQESPKVAP